MKYLYYVYSVLLHELQFTTHTNLGQEGINNAKCARPADPSTAVHDSRALVAIQDTCSSNSVEVF